jgi:UPF0755 protein
MNTVQSKSSGFLAGMFTLAGVLLVVASLVFAWLVFEYRAFTDTPLELPASGFTIEIAPGSSLRTVARELRRQGLLEHPRFFAWLGRQTGFASRIHAGEYRVEPGTTPLKLLEQLAGGKVIQHSLTLVEGWTFRQVREALAGQPALEHRLEDLSDAELMSHLGHPDEHPEGRFLPDTYHFPRGTSDSDFLKRAYDAMEDRLSQEWEGRETGLPLKDPYEALILASIIEKETARPAERAEIAGVFIRRLQRNMRLQTDPTVIYGMGSAYDGNIRARDLRTDTPYNTYTRAGLPPTPIAMPGSASVHAALHPAPGDALYFVARGDGSHEFSSSLEAHNKAVRDYQLIPNSRSSKSR